ncbi:MAG TPA: PilZ domain-containing protein [Thermodesulfovibrionales bacterium]|nr:PilZ domain-containing protein [Thermodesulfovibrionales bacterium]
MSDAVSRRIIKRLETTFSSGDSKYRGISSDLSASGLFIRTQHGLVPGSIVDIELYLPDGKICILKGTVRRTVKTGMSSLFKDGMGVELIEQDSNYREFLKSLDSPGEKYERGSQESASAEQAEEMIKEPKGGSDFILLPCPSCKVQNRVRRDKLSIPLRCGKCGEALNRGDIR